MMTIHFIAAAQRHQHATMNVLEKYPNSIFLRGRFLKIQNFPRGAKESLSFFAISMAEKIPISSKNSPIRIASKSTALK
jgi:hypothetical protein